jgi:hypothetical protein
MPVSRGVLAACLACLIIAGVPRSVCGQAPTPQDGDQRARGQGEPPGDGGHPLAAVLRWAKQEVEFLEKNVAEYSATIVSRERLNGKLGPYERIAVKIRHRPLSVYAYVAAPENRKGDEAIYVEGKNEGKLMAHTTGAMGKLFGTLSLDPTGTMAMRDKRHPISEIGILHLCREVVRFAESDMRYAECRVQFLQNAKVEGRLCGVIEVSHPVPRKEFKFHLLRLYIDEEMKIPIRWEQYDWPQQAGGAPELVEEYTYLNVKLNNGFNDSDFDPRNPNYAFP